MQYFRIPFLLILAFILGMPSCQVESTGRDTIENNNLDNWQMQGFIKVDSINPILLPDSSQTFYCPISKREVRWEARNVLNPSAVVKEDKIYLFYRAQDQRGTSRIGVAISSDGLHFGKLPAPVFYPDNDAMQKLEWHYAKGQELMPDQDYFDGVEDPRIVETEDGRYLMTYTAYDGKTARLCFAISRDLTHWSKQGPVLNDIKFQDVWSKSGAIICRQSGSQHIATKIQGKYWMYYGDTDLFMASSEDLLHWLPELNEENQLRISVLHPRPGYFDSRLVEPGPYALVRQEGILLIYNASNAANNNDPSLPKFTYAAGQALFDKTRPYRLITRSSEYFIHPDKDYERIGEVNEVCFVEGLVNFNQKWFLYYGTADSKIAVAVKD